MIYKLDYIGGIKEFFIISSVLPPPEWGLFVLILSLPIVYWLTRTKDKERFRYSNGLVLLTSSVVYAGVFIYTSEFVDEVFINLEHTYNLFHHGLFSFSPYKPVSGTVELLYYFLLTPFAFSHKALIQANYGYGFIIGWLHLFLLWSLLSNRNLYLKSFLLILFSVNYPLIRIFSDGFGSGLVSLLFFISVFWQMKGYTERALITAAALPLIRPDAILFSLVVFFVHFCHDRKLRIPYYGLTACTFFIYFFVVKLLYGQWIPIPIYFKSFSLCLVSLLSAEDFLRLVTYFMNPFHFLCLAVYVASYYSENDEIKVLRTYFYSLFPVFAFYRIVAFNPVYDGRYYVCFELCAALFVLIYFDRESHRLSFAATTFCKRFKPGADFKNIVISLSSPFLICAAAIMLHLVDHQLRWNHSRLRCDGLGVGGQIMDQVLPLHLNIAVTELNSFGYMNDREIIDLWGYTNSQIAHSRTFSKFWRIRNMPGLFLQLKPEVAFYRTVKKGSHLEGDNSDIDDIEASMPDFLSFSKKMNQFGNMLEVMALYDPVVLDSQGWVTTLLVRNDYRETILQSLLDNQYDVSNSRDFDLEKFKRIYDSQRDHHFGCK